MNDSSAAAPPLAPSQDDRDPIASALSDLATQLRLAGYGFTTPTPETIARVNARPDNREGRDLAGVFGWSRPFSPGALPVEMLDCLRRAEALAESDGLLRSLVRYSTLDGMLYVHSAAPTEDDDSIFFGPDTYRFARFIRETLRWPANDIRRIADVGCGGGAGGITAWRSIGGPTDVPVLLTDVNPKAVRAARVNARTAGLTSAQFACGDLLNAAEGMFDLVVANPPYLLDPARRTYRHGGGAAGEGLSLRILEETAPRLNPGGRLILYTGSAILAGRDRFQESCAALLAPLGLTWRYEEIDPDVFGEELTGRYGWADRIAAVGLVAQAPGRPKAG